MQRKRRKVRAGSKSYGKRINRSSWHGARCQSTMAHLLIWSQTFLANMGAADLPVISFASAREWEAWLAKKPETREKRMKNILEMMAKG